jgi:hypothetical protein
VKFTARRTVIGGVRCELLSPEVKPTPNRRTKAYPSSYSTHGVRTGIIPLATRPFLYCEVDTEEQVDGLIARSRLPGVAAGDYPYTAETGLW